MVKRYDISYTDECFHESDTGDWVMWEDVEKLVSTKINRIDIQDGDTIVVRPYTNDMWSSYTAEAIYEFMRAFLDASGHQDCQVAVFKRPVDLIVVGSHKPNYVEEDMNG